ncbi:MAG: YihY/virulence factor BrkB family protein [Planctomycetes bacterium]|nr:YihY/virulence factor BrkB family protein [Planctomycetota bacterium]
MFLTTSLHIIYRAGQKWSENGGMRLGAALSYYALFSVGPLILIAVHVCGAIFGEDAAKGEVRKTLRTMMGADAAKEVESMVKTAGEPHDTMWTPTVSVSFLVVAALGAFLHVRSSLRTIWKLDSPEDNSWLAMLWDYALSLVMVLVTATMLVVSLAVGFVASMARKTVEEHRIADDYYWHWVEIGTSFFILTLLFAASYRILSGGRIPWGYVAYGSTIAAVLFMLGKSLLSYYIVYSGTASMYGAAGSLVVFLVWVYYSSQILFFGAELIQARRTRHEWLFGEKPAPG